MCLHHPINSGIFRPIHSGQPRNEREINVVSFHVQKIRTYRILCKLPKFCCRLSSFSQWLQYIFMGIHSIQWLRNRQLTLIAFLRPYVKLAYSVNALKDVLFFKDQDLLFSKASARAVLNEMAGASISASQRIFSGGTVKNGLLPQTRFCSYLIGLFLVVCMYVCM